MGQILPCSFTSVEWPKCSAADTIQLHRDMRGARFCDYAIIAGHGQSGLGVPQVSRGQRRLRNMQYPGARKPDDLSEKLSEEAGESDGKLGQLVRLSTELGLGQS